MTGHVHVYAHMFGYRCTCKPCKWRTMLDRSCLSQAIWTSYFGTGYVTEPEVYCSVILVDQQSPRGLDCNSLIERL